MRPLSVSLSQLPIEEDRGNWKNRSEFILSCLGSVVGLGNVWRFPYLCFSNGGGAFLIPYLIFLVAIGVPLLYLELAIGQYGSLGPNVLFKKMSPFFEGIGYSMLLITFIVMIYYNVIISWSIFYAAASFTSEVPWSKCGAEWSTQDCYTAAQNTLCQKYSNGTEIYWNKTCTNVHIFCQNNYNLCLDKSSDCARSRMEPFNNTMCRNTSAAEYSTKFIEVKRAHNKISPSEEYFRNYVLSESGSWENFGNLRWQLVVCLLGAWVIVILCLINGIKSLGNVVYFTVLAPLIILTIFFIQGLTLEGSANGILFYLTPDWEFLTSSRVWYQAASQVFYTLGLSFGTLVTLSSYSPFKNDCEREALIVAGCNSAISVFAGFAVFSIIGALAKELDVEVTEVVKSDNGLAFIVFPDAIARFTYPPVWSLIFFVMLICLGIDTQCALVETVTTAIIDQFPRLRFYKRVVLFIVSGCCFILALPLCTEGGVYLLTLIDTYTFSWAILFCGLFEICAVAWVYGSSELWLKWKLWKESKLKLCWETIWDRNLFDQNVEEMLGRRPSKFWKICWIFVTPIIITAMLVYSMVSWKPVTYGNEDYPTEAHILGSFIVGSIVIIIPVIACYRIFKLNKNSEMTLVSLFQPTRDWRREGASPTSLRGPVASENRTLKATTGEATL